MKRFAIFAASCVITAGIAVATAAPANAAEDRLSCAALQTQVSAALANASGDVTEARAERRTGTDACQHGFYDMGVSHYRKALSLLGK